MTEFRRFREVEPLDANLFGRRYRAKKRERARFVNVHLDRLPGQPFVSRKDDDVIGAGPAGHLQGPTPLSSLYAFLLGPSTSTSTRLPTTSRCPFRLAAFCMASRSLLRRFFDSSGMSSANSSWPLVPGRGLYLKM